MQVKQLTETHKSQVAELSQELTKARETMVRHTACLASGAAFSAACRRPSLSITNWKSLALQLLCACEARGKASGRSAQMSPTWMLMDAKTKSSHAALCHRRQTEPGLSPSTMPRPLRWSSGVRAKLRPYATYWAASWRAPISKCATGRAPMTAGNGVHTAPQEPNQQQLTIPNAVRNWESLLAKSKRCLGLACLAWSWKHGHRRQARVWGLLASLCPDSHWTPQSRD